MKFGNIARLDKSLRLLHVNLLIKLSIDESMGDVNRVQVEILNSCKSKNKSNGWSTRGGSKDFSVIQSRTLTVTLCNNSGLIPLYGSISIMLDPKYPTRSNGFLARWQLDQLPSPICQMHIVFLFTSLSPFNSIWTFHCLGVMRRV